MTACILRASIFALSRSGTITLSPGLTFEAAMSSHLFRAGLVVPLAVVQELVRTFELPLARWTADSCSPPLVWPRLVGHYCAIPASPMSGTHCHTRHRKRWYAPWYCRHFRCWYLYSICIFVFEVRIKGKGHPVQNVVLSILANLDTLDEKITIQIS